MANFLCIFGGLKFSTKETHELFINILNTNCRTINYIKHYINGFNPEVDYETARFLQKIQEERDIVISLEDIEMHTFKITRQTHNAPDICFEDQTRSIQTEKIIHYQSLGIYGFSDEYVPETLSVRELLIRQIKTTKEKISNLMQKANLQDKLTTEAWDRLKKNKAYLDVLEEAYSKLDYDEFLKFIKTTHTKDGFTVQTSNDEDKSKRSKELKLAHFYGLAVEAFSRVNKFYQEFESSPLELKKLHINLEETVFNNILKKAKTDTDYKITNIPETIRQLEEFYEGVNGRKLPKRIISATTGKTQAYQGPKQYFKNSLLPESMLEKEDSQDSNTSNEPLAQTQNNNPINTKQRFTT